ncbi:hypothetical protein [uncultured Roseibium sp.]|uniref:hypothetical protein n=1 Tax=uncultured Roseibium sp. TaxID=1936171 RepID=UPI0026036EDA|nr:hypothetical protein [uncultured Roseibium sp.]
MISINVAIQSAVTVASGNVDSGSAASGYHADAIQSDAARSTILRIELISLIDIINRMFDRADYSNLDARTLFGLTSKGFRQRLFFSTTTDLSQYQIACFPLG